ncbi:sulfotransferase family 2 domain-containing protein [Rhizobium sp. NXC24]|uniref:sulfotransferase family 2 domain-containing protein n=1 Tax=Rhizobium sp. NXC24 TaxID=2048897 RepID=UPI000CF2F5F5|nr:sulfotransferase family 2 domain-containing protein [Rhizobium sp. NXC24]
MSRVPYEWLTGQHSKGVRCQFSEASFTPLEWALIVNAVAFVQKPIVHLTPGITGYFVHFSRRQNFVQTVGYVDGISGGEIIGWARKVGDPKALAEINIVAESGHIIPWKPTHYRPDVCNVCGEQGIFGFHVPISFLLNFGSIFSFFTIDGQELNNGRVEIPSDEGFEVGPVSVPECNFYLHIQKTMGTSVVNVIHNSLEKSRFLSIYPQFGLSVPQFIKLPLHQRRTLKLVVGHTSFGVGRYLGNRANYLTVVREPMARVRSHLMHILSDSGPTYNLCGVEYTVDEVVNNGLTDEFDNLQVRMIAGLYEGEIPLGEISLDDAKLAIHNVEQSFSYIGPLEKFRETAKTFLKRLDIAEQALPHLNEAKSQLVHKYQDTIERIDWDRVRKRHLPEIALYEYVCQKN